MAVTVLGTVSVPLVLAPDAHALASVLYVSSTGANSGDCSASSAPCATLTYALTQAASGAKINVTGTIMDHVSVGVPVTITGVSAPSTSPAVIDGSNSGTVFTVNAAGVVLDHLTIQHGRAGGDGGGVLDHAANLTLSYDTVTGNHSAAGGDGGGVDSIGAGLKITNSTFSGNTAGNIGSALSFIPTVGGSAPATISTSTFTGNGGAGAIAVNGSVTLTGDTIAQNSGGLYLLAGSARVGATLFAANTRGNCTGAQLTSVGYNLDTDGTCQLTATSDVQSADAVLGALASNGGPTQTMAPSLTSPAADRIPVGTTLNSVAACPRTDQTGRAAPVAGATSCSIGAVEAVTTVTPANTMFVSSAGSNTSNKCTSAAAPCATVSYALTQVVSGSFSVKINVSGTIHDHVEITNNGVPVTITGANATTAAVLDGSSGTAGPVIVADPGAQLHVDHLTVQHGSAGTTRPGGGGLELSNASTTLDSVTVTANTAYGLGGGVLVVGGSATIRNSTISSNVGGTCGFCTGILVGGGGIGVDSAAVSIANSTVSANNAGNSDGGGLEVNDAASASSISITGSTFAGNKATTGAAIDGTGSVAISDSTIAGNVAVEFGAISVHNGTYKITDSTVANNTGEGIYVATGIANIGATIVQGNTPQNCAGTTTKGVVSVGYNVDDGATCHFFSPGDASSKSASLGALANNGGPTQTMLPSTTGAAAFKIPTGTTLNGIAVCPRVDQRGVAGPTGGRTACSTGAVEVGGSVVAPAFTSPALHTVAWGSRFSYTVTTSGTTPALSVSPTTPLPATVTFTDKGDGTGTMAGYLPKPGTYSFTLRATNGTAPDASQIVAFVATKAPQTPLVLTSTSALPGTVLTLKTSGGSGTGAVTYAVTNGTATGCTLSTTTPYALTATSTGSCLVTATKAADTLYNAASAPRTAVWFLGNQAALVVTSTNGTFGTPLTLTTRGGSGTGAVTYAVKNGTATSCAVSTTTPYKLTSATIGTCIVTATKAGDNSWNPVSSAATTVRLADQQAALFVTSLNGTWGTPLQLATSGGSGTGALTYVAVTGSASGCSISSGALSASSAGTCLVTATKAADATYFAASSAKTTVTFAKQAQSQLNAPQFYGTFGTPITLTTTGGTGTGAVTWVATNGTATGCAISTTTPYTLSSTTGGTCFVRATKAADANYLATSSALQTATFVPVAQAALVVTSVKGTYGDALTLTTSGGSGTGAVTYVTSNVDATGCRVSSTTPYVLTVTSAGGCYVTATKAADASYVVQRSSQTLVEFARRAQVPLVITSLTGTWGTPLTLTTTGGSGPGAVTYGVKNGTSSLCQLSTTAPYTLNALSGGTCIVTASKAGNGNYLAAQSAATTVTFGKQGQKPLVLTATSGTFGTPLKLTSSGGSGSGAVTYAAANGTATGCAVSATTPYTLSSTSAGTCTVTATKATDTNYLVTSSPATTVTLAKAAQAALVVTSTSGAYGAALTLTTSGGSGYGFVTYLVANGTATGCALSAAPYTLSVTSVGTCTVTATKATDNNYLVTSSAATTVTFGKGTQAKLVVTSTTGSYGVALTLVATGGSGTGALTFTAVNGTATGCTVSTTTPYRLSVTSTGTCIVTATKATDANWLAASSAATTVTFGKGTQATLTVTSVSGVLGTPLTLTTKGGSGTGAVTYVAVNGTATGCAVSATTPYTLTSATSGTCRVTATKATDSLYKARSSAATSVLLNQAPLVVTSTRGAYGSALTLKTSGGSGTGAVTYVATSGTAPGCTVSATTPYKLTVTGVGTCIVTATKAGDGTYLSASSPATTVTFAQGNQATLRVTSTSGTFQTPITLTTSGGSSTGAVTFTAVNGTAAGCAVSAATPYVLTSTSGGTCLVTATKAGDANWNAVSSAATTVTFAKINQAPLIVTSLSGTWGTVTPLTTSGGSGGGAVSYVSVNGTATGCGVTASGVALNPTSAGTCIVTATKATDISYLAASSAATTVTFGKRSQPTFNLTSTSGTYGSALTLTASGGAGSGAVTFAAANGTALGCTVSTTTPYRLTVTSAGTCTVTATKAADANWLAATSTQAVTFVKAAQAALAVTSTSGTWGTPLTLTTNGGSGTGAVTYGAAVGTATGCTLSSTAPYQLSAASAGTCTVTATKATDTNYLAGSSAATTVTFAKQPQAAVQVTSVSGTYGVALTLTTSGGSGSGAVTFVAADGTASGCTVSAAAPYSLSVTSAGTCAVTATEAADANYLAASSDATTVTFAKAAQAALSVTSTDGVLGTGLDLTTSGGSGTGEVTFTASDGTATNCAVTGATLTADTAGTCVVTAAKDGDSNYLPVTSDPATVTIKAPQDPLVVTSTDGVFGAGLDLTTTGGSGTGALSFAAIDGTAGNCSVSGSTLTAGTAGTCIVTATKDGDADHAPTASDPTTVSFAPAAQSIAFTSTPPSDAVVGGAGYVVTATGGDSGNPVTFSLDASSTGCALDGAAVTLVAVGTCVIDADQAGDDNYAAADQQQQAFDVAADVNGIVLTFTPDAGTYSVAATGTDPGNPLTYLLGAADSGCVLDGTTTDLGPGPCDLATDPIGLSVSVPADTVTPPTGVVTFIAGSTVLCTIDLSGATSSCQIAAADLDGAGDVVTAHYSGPGGMADLWTSGSTVAIS